MVIDASSILLNVAMYVGASEFSEGTGNLHTNGSYVKVAVGVDRRSERGLRQGFTRQSGGQSYASDYLTLEQIAITLMSK